ncbi:type I-E CRISPR-associated protein Cas7/Cse4/CasC [Actinocrinis puniceicyclus]|uniref:Type I-E CRISPR-associated protein Cas7/Cse4/CasC n=1 Tax=Actinocrinis puniceicyclus TaxID=977794 RepID=A0A8J7WTX1_9ACTN|nr:type I-E CRISPR-associated protein Cas7/Cse4/CasC [Actinocrinis puniceicyclus]MBS2965655.1 type I-E CRISPR-associated protein Cas7/Cse4/CasC [Actinocrinis puniceicyclus]
MPNRLYVDVHVLQTVPPSNINRDDNGTPKHALYGGVRRSRVSSQAWKRATRLAFTDSVPKQDLATRTKRISTLLANVLAAQSGLDQQQAARLSTALLAPLGIKPGKKADDTAYLLFFGRKQLDAIAGLVADQARELAGLSDAELKKHCDKLPIIETLNSGHPIDVALFGRMVADIKGLNVDAAVQVAHALSTHGVETEFDYYTAVDDENVEDSGAGMIGTIEFNSATLYRYATVSVHQLLENLAEPEATADAVRCFIDAFVRCMPSGYGNSFAPRTLPHLVLVAMREDQPVNLVSAYEKAVRGGANGIAEESARRLAAEFQTVNETWGTAPTAHFSTYYLGEGDEAKSLVDALGRPAALPQLLDGTHETVTAWLAAGVDA